MDIRIRGGCFEYLNLGFSPELDSGLILEFAERSEAYNNA